MKAIRVIGPAAWGVVMGLVAGCAAPAQPPRVGVGDHAVFTAVHLIAAEVSAANEGSGNGASVQLNNGPFTAAEMKRYFETKASEYDQSKSRMDTMLDGQQRASAIYQAAQSQATVSVAASLAAQAAATGQTPPTPPAVTAPTPPVTADDLKTVFTALMSSPVIDSPFDQLDRVADFYAAYIIKNLRVRGDSRVVDQEILADQVLDLLKEDKPEYERFQALKKEFESRPGASDTAAGYRLILLGFQAHVDPGNMPDVWAGVRMRVTAVDGAVGERAALDTVKIIRLHPTRTYDVDQINSGQDVTRAFAGATNVSVSTPKAGVAINANANAAEDEAERRKYLSHISKVTSFADATEHSFGFNFYPSNVRVEKQYIPFGLLLTGSPTTYKASGFLEGGARDCAAILVVPRNVGSLTLSVQNVWGHIDSGDQTATGDGGHARTFTVTLPPWHPLELLAATIGAGPTRQPGAAATSRPRAKTGASASPDRSTQPSTNAGSP